MADVKISALPAATTPLDGTELVPIVQGGVTERVTVADMTAGRTVAASTLNVDANTSSAAVRITQTGAGNALLVEDSANPDSSPFVVNTDGAVGIGSTALTGYSLRVTRPVGGAVTARGILNQPTFQSDTTSTAIVYDSIATTAAATFTLPVLTHYGTSQQPLGAGSSVTTQYGFFSSANLVGATTNYAFIASNTAAVAAGRTAFGFYSAINVATGGGTTWAFYAEGTAPSFFAGDMRFDKTVTAAGTTGAQTINKNAGTVNFAAAATSLVVTNSRVNANSIIIATVATNDTTMKSVAAVAGAGSFTLNADAAATAETRVNWLVIN
jgi:hypothetical protein